jgi:hypothetical protein
LLHGAAAPAMHAPDLDLQVHPGVATREVAHSTGLAVVKGSLPLSTRSTGRFFPRRRSRKIRALGSPKMPRTVASGRNPVNRYASSSRRGFRIRASCQIFRLEEKGGNPSKQGVSRPSDATFYPLGWEKSQKKELWDALFLTLPEVSELLRHVRAAASLPWVYPAL